MKTIVFDSGPIITLTLNNITWLLDSLDQVFEGKFIIPEDVKKELIDKPLSTKKFKFEALQIIQLIRQGSISVYNNNKQIEKLSEELLYLANNSFFAKEKALNIMHKGEIGAVALALHVNAEAIVIDERTTRTLIEKPLKLVKILSRKLHTRVSVNEKNLKQLQGRIRKLRVLRSAEIVAIAYELGMLDEYLPTMSNAKKTLLEALFWGVKLNGCSISNEEIKDMITIERKIR